MIIYDNPSRNNRTTYFFANGFLWFQKRNWPFVFFHCRHKSRPTLTKLIALLYAATTGIYLLCKEFGISNKFQTICVLLRNRSSSAGSENMESVGDREKWRGIFRQIETHSEL